jgi:hypothetical protein
VDRGSVPSSPTWLTSKPPKGPLKRHVILHARSRRATRRAGPMPLGLTMDCEDGADGGAADVAWLAAGGECRHRRRAASLALPPVLVERFRSGDHVMQPAKPVQRRRAVTDWAIRRSMRGTSQVYQRSITPCHREPLATLPHQTSGTGLVRSVTIFGAVPGAGTRPAFSHASRGYYGLYLPPERTSALMFAPCLLDVAVRLGSGRHYTAPALVACRTVRHVTARLGTE